MAHKLDPYTGIIDARLEEFPKLSARRLFEEVRAAGYAGSYGGVRDYVREVRPREPVEEPVRFETPPGRQGQVDFGTFRFPWGRRYALVVVLGYSRLLWLRFYSQQTMAVLVDGLESASRQATIAGPVVVGASRRRSQRARRRDRGGLSCPGNGVSGGGLRGCAHRLPLVRVRVCRGNCATRQPLANLVA